MHWPDLNALCLVIFRAKAKGCELLLRWRALIHRMRHGFQFLRQSPRMRAPYFLHVLDVGVAGARVDLLGARPYLVCPVVTGHEVLRRVYLSQGRVVHQFGQLALVVQLAPSRGQDISAGAS